MVKVKVNMLEGKALDYAAAVAEGWGDFEDMVFCSKEGSFAFFLSLESFNPSTDWSQGGTIIEREKIRLRPDVGWSAALYWPVVLPDFRGQTPLTAAMRCYVASKLGDVVDIPDELI